MSTEAIYAALFALVSKGEGLPGTIAWTNPDSSPGSLTWTSRRVKDWDGLPGQPALCQAEHDETIVQVTGQYPKTMLGASWLIYLNDGKDTSPGVVPAKTTNAVLDAIKALFTSEPEAIQTLGGLVHYARIEGNIIKIQGDLDGQSLIVVPIKMLVP